MQYDKDDIILKLYYVHVSLAICLAICSSPEPRRSSALYPCLTSAVGRDLPGLSFACLLL